MSLINRMLQDLDKRGLRLGTPIESNVLAVPRQHAPLSIALGALLLLLSVGAGLFGWRYLMPGPAVPRVVMVPPVLMVPTAPPAVVALPVAPSIAPPVVEIVPAAPSADATAPPAPAGPAATKGPVAVAALARKAPATATATHAGGATARAASSAPLPSSFAAFAAAGTPETGRQMSAQQRAESAYRRALAALQEARVNEAIGALEQALVLEPGHEAARQTLVGLLIESRRADEAMRQLQQGLALDARQSALAMLLARMQMERGETGIDTLLRSLPHAAGNANYHAFLGAALQRQQRHREAVEQYQAAVRAMPKNGVWLMGLGISLQAEKRNTDALDAFRQARAAANLAPELQAFVARKVQQLSD